MQVLSLLETLVSPDSDWLWILWHLDITTFSVTRTGQVSNMNEKCENHSFKGCSLYFGEPHPCGSKPGGSTTSRGERSMQPQLFHGVETRGNWAHPKSVEDVKKLKFRIFSLTHLCFLFFETDFTTFNTKNQLNGAPVGRRAFLR